MNKNNRQDKNKPTLILKRQTIRQLADVDLRLIAGGASFGSLCPHTGCCTDPQ